MDAAPTQLRTYLLHPAPPPRAPHLLQDQPSAAILDSPDVTRPPSTERRRQRQCRIWWNCISCFYWSRFVPPLGFLPERLLFLSVIGQ